LGTTYLGRYEGSLIQLTIGDKGSYLYAVFGAPVAHDDDAFRAMHAAHDLLSPPGALDFARNIRIGLAQGVMWTGAYGSPARRTYGVMGDKTNLAARLMERAAPGTIACDDDMYRHVCSRWQFEALPPFSSRAKE
jgi:class 3 adenylate cyclase